MPSTASAWLMGDGDIAELDDVMVAAGVPVRALTEYPPWMKRAIARKLQDSFGEAYWTDIMESFGIDVSDYLQRGLRDGLSIRRMALDMAEMMEDGQYARNRATNIARTEAAGALNGARREGMDLLAEELGIGNWGDAPMRPVWLSVLGTTTRDTHADLDGVPCDKDGMWELGGVRVPHPGHPDLPPEERCNCQCTIAMEFGLRDEESQQLIEDYYSRIQRRAVELRTKVTRPDNDARLEEHEAHPDWEALLNEHEEFARVLQAPLTSRVHAQRLADRITKRLGVHAVWVVFKDGPSSIGDGRLADYQAADEGKATVTFFDEPNSKSASVLVHELAHHTQQVLRGQDAHGAGHNKHFRLVAEALIGIERGDDGFSLNDWWREQGRKGTKADEDGHWVTTSGGSRLFLTEGGELRTGPVGEAVAGKGPRLPKEGEEVKVRGNRYWAESVGSDDAFPPAVASYEVVDGVIFYRGRDGSEGIVTGSREEVAKWMSDVDDEVKRRTPSEARPWKPDDGGAQNAKRAEDQAVAAAAAFGLEKPNVSFIVQEHTVVGGEHSADGSVAVWNPQEEGSPSLSFSTSGISTAEHVAAHEVAHQAFSKDPEAGRRAMGKLSETGSYVSMYHMLAGDHEGLMDAAAAYIHSPAALREYSSEIYDVVDEWSRKLRGE